MKSVIKDIPIYYEIHGSGRPIVMIHGFTPDHRLMLGCMEPIFQTLEGWQRIYFDLPGMGQTPGPDWLTTSDQMLEVVQEFIRQVLPGQHYCVAGESYGGYLTQGLVVQDAAPIEGVLYICPATIAHPANSSLPQHLVLEQEPGLLESLTPEQRAAYEPLAVVQTRKNWEMVKNDILPGLQAADRPFLDRLWIHYAFSFENRLTQVVYEKPALILTARQDSAVGYDGAWKWAMAYPRATYAVLDCAGHNLQIEQVDLFSALVSEWLQRVEKGWR